MGGSDDAAAVLQKQAGAQAGEPEAPREASADRATGAATAAAAAAPKKKGGLLEFGTGGSSANEQESARRAVGSLLRESRADDPSGPEVLKSTLKDFLEKTKDAEAPQSLEDKRAAATKATEEEVAVAGGGSDGQKKGEAAAAEDCDVEISLVVDDLVEVGDLPGISAPDKKDGILLPTDNTQQFMTNGELHQAAALTSMVCCVSFPLSPSLAVHLHARTHTTTGAFSLRKGFCCWKHGQRHLLIHVVRRRMNTTLSSLIKHTHTHNPLVWHTNVR